MLCALCSVVDYYTTRGSTVNLCTLDVSKAFDRVNHHGVYLKLMKRHVPKCFLNLLINWYSRCVAFVRKLLSCCINVCLIYASFCYNSTLECQLHLFTLHLLLIRFRRLLP